MWIHFCINHPKGWKLINEKVGLALAGCPDRMGSMEGVVQKMACGAINSVDFLLLKQPSANGLFLFLVFLS